MIKKIIGQTYIWVLLLLMYLPILILIAFSFTEATNVGEWTGFSFNLYAALFKNEAIMVALGNTLLIAFISACVSTVLGTLGAIGAFYAKKGMRKGYDMVTNIPIANAEIIIAFSLTVMFVFLGRFVFHAYLFSFWTLLIGHVVLSLPFVYISVKPKLEQMDPSLYEAALDLGCTPSRALRKVVIPETIPGVLSGFLLSITLSLDDFIITSFTRGPGLLSGSKEIETLSTLVQAKIKKGPIPTELRPLTTIIFLLVVLGVIGVTIYRNREAKVIRSRRKRAHYGQ